MNLPLEFVERTRALLGKEAWQELETALQTETPVSIRVNRAKRNVAVAGNPVPWAADGMYLSSRPAFTFDPFFHAGCYYVQEASSMFVEQVFRTHVTKPAVVLDLCAAPGGKSTHIRSLLPVGSLLIANEVVRARSQVLVENLVKWGHADVVVTRNDPSDFSKLTGLFDVILADMPCSGEGMFRKDLTAVTEWSTAHVEICRQRQRRILMDIWPALKPGGLLIYSTCTYNREENEENVAWAVHEWDADVLEVPVKTEWGITGNLAGANFPVCRFLPHKTKGEGFFLAVLRKKEDAPVSPVKRNGLPISSSTYQHSGKKGKYSVPSVSRETMAWLEHPDDFLFAMKGTEIKAFPQMHAPMYALLQQTLRVIHAGIPLGECKGKDIVPHHALAMSTALNPKAFAQMEVNYEQAIAYLRKETVVPDALTPRGYVLLTYRNVPLGFAKNIGNRANNLYPQEWRIRSGYLPEEKNFVW